MQSSRALGIFALAAVILAAISFAAVDVIVTTPSAEDLPSSALLYGAIGTVALLASIVPAFMWFSRFLEHPHHDADIEPMPISVHGITAFEDDEL